MLRFSNQSVTQYIPVQSFRSFKSLADNKGNSYRWMIKMILLILTIFIIVLFLPWTQNIRAHGELIALMPEQRPQTIQAIIPGRIEKWYVQEGQFVKKGDTILQISETQEEFFDPSLLKNTKDQIDAKKRTMMSYDGKVSALEQQIEAIRREQTLKLEQTKIKILQNKLKVQSDSMDLVAEKVNYEVVYQQFLRFQSLYNDGLKSLTDLESRKLKLQEVQAKLVSQENKLDISINELFTNTLELKRLEQEYKDKLSKIDSDKYSALSGKYDTDALIFKMENQYANFVQRAGYYFVLAPQDGYITKALKAGIGEIMNAGTDIVSIMPSRFDIAIEMYVRPIDLPLLDKGHKVMIQFDGWPAIVFSGWPGISYGTYIGEVYAIDQFISDNKLYRVLVIPSKEEQRWPEALRVGTGVKTITFLKNVMIWYEMWRQINGFPPDYYRLDTVEKHKIK
ncbi:MAG: HlyD family efflux transporter periplasmic adaptor subunit [Saprospiraceae bacterium]